MIPMDCGNMAMNAGGSPGHEGRAAQQFLGEHGRGFVRIARGTLYETRHWLRRAYVRKLLSFEEVDRIKEVVDKLGPQLNSYLKSIGPSTKDK